MRILALLLLGACNKGDGEWTNVAEGLDSALLSITGTTSHDVWTVGADAGAGPLVAHYDGAAWSTLDTGTTGDLWWVWQEGGDVIWMVGAGGRVIRRDETADTTDEEVLDPDLTLFGIWGTTGDLWAVGGNLVDSTPGLWRLHGAGWEEQTLPTEAQGVRGLYKVWGTGPTDVWVVGTAGAILHFDGSAWSLVTSPNPSNLFTVSGVSANEVYAVGGDGAAAALRWDGTSWSDESPGFTPQFNGVFARASSVVAVGVTGVVCWREGGAWVEDARGSASFEDFHAAWLDDQGALWAVGGSIASAPLDAGMIVYGGDDPPATFSP